MNSWNHRPAASLLAELLLGDEPRARAAAQAAQDRGSWMTLIRTSRAWRILPPLAERVRHFGVDLPEQESRLLRESLHEAAAQSTLVAHTAANLLASLAAVGIDAVPFKGVALIAGLYGNPARRMISDVDVLVLERDIEAVEELLVARGVRPLLYQSVQEYRADRLGARSNNYAMPFRDEDGVEVDLHWCLSERSNCTQFTQLLLADAVDARLMGNKIRIPSPADAMLLTVHHVVRSDMSVASLLKDLRDVLCWWILRPGSWELADLLDRARSLDIETAMLACLEVLTNFNGHARLAEDTVFLRSSLTAEQCRLASEITALMLYRIEIGRINPDLVAVYQRGALKRWIRARILRPRWVAEHEGPKAAGSVRRLLRLVSGSVRQRGFERAGYRALATVRERLMGEKAD